VKIHVTGILVWIGLDIIEDLTGDVWKERGRKKLNKEELCLLDWIRYTFAVAFYFSF